MKECYDKWFNIVLFAVKRFGLRDEECEEVAQEAFLRYLENQDRIDQSKVGGFLLATARNMSIDMLRKKKRHQTNLVDDNLENTEESLWHSDPRRILEAEVVDRFLTDVKGEPGGDILVMFYRDGMTTKQIAELRQETVNTITSRLSRARTKFKERLRAELEKS